MECQRNNRVRALITENRITIASNVINLWITETE